MELQDIGRIVAGFGVFDSQEISMQGLSAKTLQSGFCLGAEPAGFGLESGAVGGVAQDRMADMGQMHPDLMGPAGFEGAGEQAGDRLAVVAAVSYTHLRAHE